jgi:hypothetical protein
LLVAVGFSALANLTLLSTFVWRELVESQIQLGLWVSLVVCWLLAVVASRGWRVTGGESAEAAMGSDHLFPEGLSEYLQGNWLEAERRFRRAIQNCPWDVESRLMLATVLRHARRWDEARIELRRTAETKGAQHWAFEIERESAYLDELAARDNPLLASLTTLAGEALARKQQPAAA